MSVRTYEVEATQVPLNAQHHQVACPDRWRRLWTVWPSGFVTPCSLEEAWRFGEIFRLQRQSRRPEISWPPPFACVLLGLFTLHPRRWRRYDIPTRRPLSQINCVRTQKTVTFMRLSLRITFRRREITQRHTRTIFVTRISVPQCERLSEPYSALNQRRVYSIPGVGKLLVVLRRSNAAESLSVPT
jgi:hypothetical protein